MSGFSARLGDAVGRFGPLCVGLDPRAESLPAQYRTPAPADGVLQFCLRILELVRPFTGVVKPQSAFFEMLGPAGFAALRTVMHRAADMGFITILDAKRGDIASTAEAYAGAAFGEFRADSLTVNPYLGADAVEPFVTAARQGNRGLFVLVRTSNPGAGLFQDLDCGGQPLYRRVAAAVAAWDAGRGDVGAVAGATHPAELLELRNALPSCWLLVPGYGAQGGTAADVRSAYRADGLGAVVNSSRGVTFPFKPDDPAWEAKVAAAAAKAQAELRA